MKTAIINESMIQHLTQKINSQEEFKYVLAIDFDHTICMSNYPEVGPIKEDAKEVINTLYKEGFGIIINTCREGLPLASAINWLKENDIPYHYINCNFPYLITKYKADCRKISADMYIDDKNINGIPEWKEIYLIIQNKFKINEK